MMKFFLLSLSLASASAFAPVKLERAATSLAAASIAEGETPAEPEPADEPAAPLAATMVGGEGPEPMLLGGSSVNWDPCGFAERAPEWTPWFREAELKHGRAAMLATVGIVAPEYFRVPGEQFSFESVPNVLQAHDALPGSMIQIFGWISFVEACTIPALANMNGFDRAPGDYGFDPIGLMPEDPAKADEMRLKELKNGRLAMIAIGGMVAGSSITGHPFPYLP